MTLDSSAPDYRARILAEQADAEHRLASLSRRFTAIVEGSEFTTDDDEHDPEGSTIAFERAQVSALLTDARRDVEELTAALARLDAGTYGTCIRCGRPIADVRLDALPAVRTCIECSG